MAPIPERNKEQPDNGHNEVDDFEMPQFTVDTVNTDSDEGADDAYAGYQQLPQDPDNCVDSQEESEEAGLNDLVINSLQNEDFISACAAQDSEQDIETEFTERKQLWKDCNKCNKIKLDEGKTQAIQSAMAKFSLPQSCIPDWAKQIPETEWKSKLLLKLDNNGLSSDSNEKLKSDFANSTENTSDKT